MWEGIIIFRIALKRVFSNQGRPPLAMELVAEPC